MLWTVACQFPLSIGFTRQEYWSGLPFPSPEDLPDRGIEPRSPTLQVDTLLSEPPGKSCSLWGCMCFLATLNLSHPLFPLGLPGGSEVKASGCNVGDLGSIPGSGRFPGEGNGNPLQYSCLENPMDGGAWWATVHGSQRVRHD